MTAQSLEARPGARLAYRKNATMARRLPAAQQHRPWTKRLSGCVAGVGYGVHNAHASGAGTPGGLCPSLSHNWEVTMVAMSPQNEWRRPVIKIGRFMQARPVGMAPHEVYTIHARSNGTVLGMVEWHARWREYVVQMEQDAVLSTECLQDLAAFLDNCNRPGQGRGHK